MLTFVRICRYCFILQDAVQRDRKRYAGIFQRMGTYFGSIHLCVCVFFIVKAYRFITFQLPWVVWIYDIDQESNMY